MNLIDDRVEVYSEPSFQADVPGYAALQTYRAGDLLPLILDGKQVARVPVAYLLP